MTFNCQEVFSTISIIYLGPFEAFENFDILKQAVLLIKETGFSVHLNTTAKFLPELADTQKKFFELREAGVDTITLRLNEETLNRCLWKMSLIITQHAKY